MLFFSKVHPLDLMLFTKHLSVMTKSGITTAEALHVMSEEIASKRLRKVIRKVVLDIENGDTLSHALGKHPKVFGGVYVSLIAVGEESGTLQENFDFLAKQLSEEYALRKKVQGILLYPMIVLSFAFVMGGFISLFILPKLTNLFQSFDMQLPLTTRILLFISDTMKSHGIEIFAGIFIGFILLRGLLQVPFIRPLWHALVLRMPLYGRFVKNVALARMCRDLGIMLNSGLTITRALEIEHTAMDNDVFKKYITRLQASVMKGGTLSKELLQKDLTHMPVLVGKMVSVGEKTGKLEETFLYLGEFFKEEVDSTAKNFTTVLEPILLLFIGLIVAFVALAIISPIYSLTSSVRH